jgi:hypothetical protein
MKAKRTEIERSSPREMMKEFLADINYPGKNNEYSSLVQTPEPTMIQRPIVEFNGAHIPQDDSAVYLDNGRLEIASGSHRVLTPELSMVQAPTNTDPTMIQPSNIECDCFGSCGPASASPRPKRSATRKRKADQHPDEPPKKEDCN